MLYALLVLKVKDKTNTLSRQGPGQKVKNLRN